MGIINKINSYIPGNTSYNERLLNKYRRKLINSIGEGDLLSVKYGINGEVIELFKLASDFETTNSDNYSKDWKENFRKEDFEEWRKRMKFNKIPIIKI
ncbi:hypothetical protein HN014_22125 (plasmid) [Aquimarina sp. TRL1]|uniref:hypothetical protein n=1 Tax=Aquimarina sp. (strain TRL1) TaxID=2736252 RepID=UPI00158F3AD3|nr:hypothetical protein [Aquimarina sp. TRL1]QKX07699.1 hypothetical protein HN014_22125 [Aquimarina sp. TRL1]